MESWDELSICWVFPPSQRMLEVMQVGSAHPQSNNLQSLPNATLAGMKTQGEQTSALWDTMIRLSLQLQRGVFVQEWGGICC